MEPPATPAAAELAADENERRLELALAAGAMGVFEWNIAESRIDWSPAIERMHGIPVGSFEGTFEAYERDIHPDDRDRVFAAVRRTLEDRKPHYISYRIIRPDGEIRWLEAHGRLVVDKADAPQRLIGVCRDVTDQRENESIRSRAAAAEAAQREAERGRARLASILSSIPDPFTVLDRQLRVLQINDSAARLLGSSPGELVGQRITDLPGEASNLFRAGYERVLRTGKAMSTEEYLQPWDRWYEASIYPVEDGMVIYARDVTIRKRAMEITTRLARTTALRADIAATLADERDLAVMLRRVCELLVDHLDLALARVWTSNDEELVLQASAGTDDPRDGSAPAEVTRIAESRRSHIVDSFAGYPLLVDGRMIGVLGLFSTDKLADDTTTMLESIADLVAQGLVRRRTEVELAHRLEDLARSNKELEQFAYVASHDLQEPLRMVASYNQLLARRYKGKLGEDADEFIGFTVEGVTRMQRLINDLLAYSRVGTRGGERVDVDMMTVLQATMSNLERAIADESATITCDPLPHVMADEGQMIQLMQNLIGNAIKFHGEEKPRVHVGVKADGSGVTFSVRDNGIGIDPQYFDRIFIIFQRLNPREQYAGTGIGLAICKKIVERHGGRIWVESTPGEGSTVLFTIPNVPRRTT
ncbi:MAG: PAS domain-containing protein [Kofleriaceae bacterium]|nr:PAS domain-containing protein [Kofleriaceae bacterium]